jgi:hypothetical protein
MGDKVVADTQYNDLIGTAAFDGHDHPPVHELAARSTMSEGYWPVGFEMFRFDPDAETGKVPFTLLAVRLTDMGYDLEKGGNRPERIMEFARSDAEVAVYRFPGEIDPLEFPAVFKRIDIKVHAKYLGKANLVAYDPSER